MKKIEKAQPLDGYRLEITFNDSIHGTVDLWDLAGKGVFEIWTDQEEFRKVSIGELSELGWPEGVDLCPDSLYLKATGKEPRDILPSLNRTPGHAG